MLSKYEYFMLKAIELANEAKKIEEIPVGAIIVKNNKIVSTGFNKKEIKKNSLFHAEMECIFKASKKLESWRLLNCEIYTTLEPCIMCMGAIINSRIEKVIFGAKDDLNGACISNKLNLKYSYFPKIHGGILETKCSNLIKIFFKELRSKNMKNKRV